MIVSVRYSSGVLIDSILFSKRIEDEKLLMIYDHGVHILIDSRSCFYNVVICV